MERLSIPFLEINVPAVLLYEMQKGNVGHCCDVCLYFRSFH